MDSPITLLAFFSVFHILGGGAMGSVFRNLRQKEKSFQDNIVLLIWGAMFGGIPLFYGLEVPILLPFQILILIAAFLVAFFYMDRLREILSHPWIALTVFGGIFFIAGCVSTALSLRAKDISMAILFGSLFGGLGILLVMIGLFKGIKPPSDSSGT